MIELICRIIGLSGDILLLTLAIVVIAMLWRFRN